MHALRPSPDIPTPAPHRGATHHSTRHHHHGPSIRQGTDQCSVTCQRSGHSATRAGSHALLVPGGWPSLPVQCRQVPACFDMAAAASVCGLTGHLAASLPPSLVMPVPQGRVLLWGMAEDPAVELVPQQPEADESSKNSPLSQEAPEAGGPHVQLQSHNQDSSSSTQGHPIPVNN